MIDTKRCARYWMLWQRWQDAIQATAAAPVVERPNAELGEELKRMHLEAHLRTCVQCNQAMSDMGAELCKISQSELFV